MTNTMLVGQLRGKMEKGKRLYYEQNGVEHKVSNDVIAFGPSLVWALSHYRNLSKSQKAMLRDIHGLLCANLYGKVYYK